MTTLRTMTGRLPEGKIEELDSTYDDTSNVTYVRAMWRLLATREHSKFTRWQEKNRDILASINQAAFSDHVVTTIESYFAKVLAPSADHELSVKHGEVGFYVWAQSASERASEPTELPEDHEWSDDWNSVSCPMD